MTMITEDGTLVTKPRQATAGRKEVTGEIARDEAAADKLLKAELDRPMRKFKKKEPAFFGEYTSARMIIGLGERHEPDAPAGPAAPTQ